VKIAATPGQAVALPKAVEFVVVMVDQQLQEADPHESERVLWHIGIAPAVYVNLAISAVERVIREIANRLAPKARPHCEAGRGTKAAK
jgi:hypothetical protein